MVSVNMCHLGTDGRIAVDFADDTRSGEFCCDCAVKRHLLSDPNLSADSDGDLEPLKAP